MPAVPVGWLESSPMGKPIDGTRFLAFKVPLKETLCRNMDSKNRFSPEILIKEAPKLSMIIDLTNTSRYYNKDDFKLKGIKHCKIFCPGKVVPNQKVVEQFFYCVENFMECETDKEKLIGVHCTHGINRTGYFICKYMIHRMGFKPDEAIRAFQEARGHDIIREYLVNDLKKNIYSNDNEQRTNRPKSSGSKKNKKNASPYSIKGADNDSRGSASNIRPQFRNPEQDHLVSDPFYRNVQKNNQYSRTHSTESNTRMERSSNPSNRTDPHNRPYNDFYPQFSQNATSYSQSSQLNYYDDVQETTSRYNNRRGRY